MFAADSDKHAIAALQAAAKKASGLKPIEAVARDLFREPLSATELNDFDAVVFDPPRAGAEAQAKMIAKSKVKTVVAVSCNPATLARDARTLIDGGYSLESVTPVDQFEYSPHIEAVAVFRKCARHSLALGGGDGRGLDGRSHHRPLRNARCRWTTGGVGCDRHPHPVRPG